MSVARTAPPTLGERMFSRLGRFLVRHPWYPILFWVALVALALPFFGQLGSVTTNSATQLPSSAPSSIAAQEMEQLFPNSSVGAGSLLLLTAPDVTGPAGRDATLALTHAIATDPKITELANVSTLYTAYQGYLEGTARLGLGVVHAGLTSSPSVPSAVAATAQLLWYPTALLITNDENLTALHPGTTGGQWLPASYRNTSAELAGANASLRAVLDAVYPSINRSATDPSGCGGSFGIWPCVEPAAIAGLTGVVPTLFPTVSGRAVGLAVVGNLSISNYSQSTAQHISVERLFAAEAGLPTPWIDAVWSQFPNATAPSAALGAWTGDLVANWTLATSPLPVPFGMWTQFVDGANDATLVFVTFSVSDSHTTPSGSTPVYDDLGEIDRVAAAAVASSDASMHVVQTGGAPLDQTESSDLSSSLALVLPLTVLVLILITMLYFRAPLAPGVTFGGLGIALALGIGGVVLIGKLITHVDTTAITLENTFVLGVGTDYSIFLLARYREELHKGQASNEAVVTAVTWAGQSVATSGATAILATLALAFSGVALLSQWGTVLSLAVLLTVLVSLTVVPSLLVLLGPRVFWPSTGARMAAESERTRERLAQERTYFFRAGRATQRRPRAAVALVLLVSLPLLIVALNVPLSFDFYQQLPGGQPATDGLASLGSHFGPGFAFPFVVLVTFARPVSTGTAIDVGEFSDLGNMTSIIQGTPGVASVASPVGPFGASLPTWRSYSSASPGTQQQLAGILAGFVGTDGHTLQLTVTPSSSGLSVGAVHLLATIEGELGDYRSAHPSVTTLAYGGGASVTNDLQQQTALATERMAIAVAIGLLIVLLVALRSWIIPVLAVATIGVSIGWAWGVTDVVMRQLLGYPLFFFVPTIMFILILGLGIDYNIFLLTRVREERLRGHRSPEAVVQAVASTGGIISAAAVILASAFAILTVGSFILLRTLGFAVAVAVILDAMVVRTYLVPAALQLLGERVWSAFRRKGDDLGRGSAPPAR